MRLLLYFLIIQSFFTRAFDRIREEQLQEVTENEAAGNVNENVDRLNATERAVARLQPPAPLVSTVTSNAIVELHRRTAANFESAGSSSNDYYHDLTITVRYNLARLHEAMHRPDLAEEIYKSILLQHPTYVDCMFIVGVFATDEITTTFKKSYSP